MQQKYLILVAGGTGSRMQSQLPKQFLLINNTPIIVLSCQQFIKYDSDIKIIISVHQDYETYLRNLLTEYLLNYGNKIEIVLGGDTRFQSVKNGLNIITNTNGVVAIHDAARPFVSQQTIANCYTTAIEKGNAIPVIPVFESLRQVADDINKAVNRAEYNIVQTPQCFRLDIIKAAFNQPYNKAFTDDATVLESEGHKINLVEGNVENIKITTPNDLKLAQAFLIS